MHMYHIYSRFFCFLLQLPINIFSNFFFPIILKYCHQNYMLPLHDWVFIRCMCNPFHRKHFNLYKMFNCDWWWNQAAKELLSKIWKNIYINEWKTLTHPNQNRNYGFSCSMEQERDIKRQKMMNNMHFIWVFFDVLDSVRLEYLFFYACLRSFDGCLSGFFFSLSLYLSCVHFSMAIFFSFRSIDILLCSSTDLR